MNKLGQKIVLFAVGTVCVAVFVYFDLSQYLTLTYLKESQARFQEMYANNRLGVIAAYTAIYVLVTGLSLPGAVILTLAGGGLFGLVVGTVVVSFASTLGATLACVVSRFLLQEWVQGKFADKLTAINQGIEREGAFYLFTMRLIPAFLFFLGMLIWPTIAFGYVANIIQQADASLKRLQTIYNEDIEIKESAETDKSIERMDGGIKFENVSYDLIGNPEAVPATSAALTKNTVKPFPTETDLVKLSIDHAREAVKGIILDTGKRYIK